MPLAPAGERRRVRRAFERLLPLGPTVERHLRGVVQDTLDHPGSLARAQLAYGLGTRLGMAPGAAMKLAIGIEYFHAASLIFDDMPAMDGASVRRGRPCPHLVHGEGAAILGALGLITRGYALTWEAISDAPAALRRRAATLVGDCLGVAGILDGQARDLHFGVAGACVHEAEHAAAAKTVPLLRLAVVLPALVAGADRRVLGALDRLTSAWGLAYQILDDFKDRLLDDREAGKTTARDALLGRPNLPSTAGDARARVRLDERLDAARRALAGLRAGCAGDARWDPLCRMQAALEAARAEVVARLCTASSAS